MKYCSHCGTEIIDEAVFCVKCGRSVANINTEEKNAINKTTLRIISKIGLIIVMIGFCMPIACNSNGFQIAEFGMNLASGFGDNSFNGINPLSLALYGIFIFSSIGAILLLLLVMGKNISISWDWLSVIGVLLSSVIVIIRFSDGGINLKILQSGAYVIVTGFIFALIFMIMAASKDKYVSNNDGYNRIIVIIILTFIFLIDIFFITKSLITDFNNKNEEGTSQTVITDPDSPYVGKKPEYNYYTIDSITVRTTDFPVSSTVSVEMIIGYDLNDLNTSAELVSRQYELRDFVRRYFSDKYASELVPEREEELKMDIKEKLNTKFFNTAKIKIILFNKLDVMENF